jgi:hypothetical protein
MTQWYKVEWEHGAGNKFYYTMDPKMPVTMIPPDRGGAIYTPIDYPPAEWMTKKLKDNAEWIKAMIDENEELSNRLSEHYAKK